MSFTRDSFLKSMETLKTKDDSRKDENPTLYYGQLELKVSPVYKEGAETYSWNDYLSVLDTLKNSYEKQKGVVANKGVSTYVRNQSTVVFQEYLTRFVVRVAVTNKELGSEVMQKIGYNDSVRSFEKTVFPSLFFIKTIIDGDFIEHMEKYAIRGREHEAHYFDKKISSNNPLQVSDIFAEFLKNFFNSVGTLVHSFNTSEFNKKTDVLSGSPKAGGKTEPEVGSYFVRDLKNYIYFRDEILKKTMELFVNGFKNYQSKSNNNKYEERDRLFADVIFSNIVALFRILSEGFWKRVGSYFARNPEGSIRGPLPSGDPKLIIAKWKGFILKLEDSKMLTVASDFLERYASNNTVASQEGAKKSLFQDPIVEKFFLELKKDPNLESLVVNGVQIDIQSRKDQSMTVPKAIQVTHSSVGREQQKKNVNRSFFEYDVFSNVANWVALLRQVILEDPIMPFNYSHVSIADDLKSLFFDKSPASDQIYISFVKRAFRSFVFFRALDNEHDINKILKEFLLLNAFTFISKEKQTSPIVVRPMAPIMGQLTIDDTRNIVLNNYQTTTLVDIFTLSEQPSLKEPNSGEKTFIELLSTHIRKAFFLQRQEKLNKQMKKAQSKKGAKNRQKEKEVETKPVKEAKEKVVIVFYDGINKTGNKKKIIVSREDCVFATSQSEENKIIVDAHRKNAHADVYIVRDDGSAFYVSLKKSNFSYWSGVNLERLGGIRNIKAKNLSPEEMRKIVGKQEHVSMFSETGKKDVARSISVFGNLITSLFDSLRSLPELKSGGYAVTAEDIQNVQKFLLSIPDEFFDRKNKSGFSGSNFLTFNKDALFSRFYQILSSFKEAPLQKPDFNKNIEAFLSYMVKSFVYFVENQAVIERYSISDVSKNFGLTLHGEEQDISILFWSFIYEGAFLYRTIFGEERKSSGSPKGAEHVHAVFIGDLNIESRAGFVEVSPADNPDSFVIFSDIAKAITPTTLRKGTSSHQKYLQFFSNNYPVLTARQHSSQRSFNIEGLYVYVSPLSVLANGDTQLLGKLLEKSKNELENTVSSVMQIVSLEDNEEKETGEQILQENMFTLKNKTKILFMDPDTSLRHKFGFTVKESAVSSFELRELFAGNLRKVSEMLNNEILSHQKTKISLLPQNKRLSRLVFRLETPDDFRAISDAFKSNITELEKELFRFTIGVRLVLSEVEGGLGHAKRIASILSQDSNLVATAGVKVVASSVPPEQSMSGENLLENYEKIKKLQKYVNEVILPSAAEKLLSKNKTLVSYSLGKDKLLPRNVSNHWSGLSSPAEQFIDQFSRYIASGDNVQKFINEIISFDTSIENIKRILLNDIKATLFSMQRETNSEFERNKKNFYYHFYIDKIDFNDNIIKNIVYEYVYSTIFSFVNL